MTCFYEEVGRIDKDSINRREYYMCWGLHKYVSMCMYLLRRRVGVGGFN